MSASPPTLSEALLGIEAPAPVSDGTWSPLPGRARRVRACAIVSEALARMWRDARPERLGCASALCLTGSFARGEGGPKSDLDVVILVESDSPALAEVVHDLLAGLWDTGLGVDHSVRTPEQCEQIAKSDLPALAGLLDLAPVSGERALADSVIQRVHADLRKQAPARIEELLADANARWSQWDLLHQVNEPHLKDCRGGIRDLDLMRVLTAAWLADRPHGPLDEALALLLDVRDALHLVTRRHTAKLLRADQREVARVLGFEGEEAEADLRRLLTGAGTEIDAAVRRVVDAAERQAPSWGAGALARRVIRAVAPGRGRRSGAYEATMVSESTSLVDSRLAFPAPALASDTAAVLDMARCCADTGIEPAGSALDAISAAVWKGEHAIRGRWTPEVTRSFEALLAAPRGFVRAWTHLETTGVIDAWIPEFAEVRSRPQSAAFHRWTVDRHLAETVARANDARTGVEAWAWPFPEAIVPWDSVLLAALLHDLGKRPGAHGPDHPALGAALVPTVLERLGLGGRSADVSLLVDRHLVLAELATKEDPAAPRTADRLLEAVGGSERALAALAVLTRADSQGAGPKAWTAWRAELIAALVRSAWERLGRGTGVR